MKPFEQEPFQRFSEHLPVDGDLALIVLKGHLLMEEQLWALVDARLSLEPDVRKRFEQMFQSSRQLILLAEALVPPEDIHFYDALWIWDAANKLNALRNHMAHKLEPRGVEEKCAAIAEVSLLAHERTDPRTDFVIALFKICHALSSLRTSPDVRDFD